MKKLHFSITIKAPREKVWHTMLDDATYRQWTEAFAAGSHYVGNWKQGSKMLFLAPEGESTAGMVSWVKEIRPYEFIAVEHLGIVTHGKEDTISDSVRSWSGAHENYTFREADNQTELLVDLETIEEFEEMFRQTWPEALLRLKDIAEGRAPRTITVSAFVRVPLAKVWEYWIQPEHIVHWAFASDDWEALSPENDVRVGGRFKTMMAAKDKSESFDFSGAYTAVKEHALLAYKLDDGRQVKIQFNQLPDGIDIIESFEPEKINPPQEQRSGWQAILNNFKKYTEGE